MGEESTDVTVSKDGESPSTTDATDGDRSSESPAGVADVDAAADRTYGEYVECDVLDVTVEGTTVRLTVDVPGERTATFDSALLPFDEHAPHIQYLRYYGIGSGDPERLEGKGVLVRQRPSVMTDEGRKWELADLTDPDPPVPDRWFEESPFALDELDQSGADDDRVERTDEASGLLDVSDDRAVALYVFAAFALGYVAASEWTEPLDPVLELLFVTLAAVVVVFAAERAG